MSLMGIITGGWTDIAKAKEEKKAMENANRIAQQAAATEQGNIENERLYQRGLNQPFYEAGLPAFRSYASAITGGIDPNTGRTWTPTSSAAYQWQQSQLEKNLGRKLRSLGRSNSTFGMNAMREGQQELAANEYDKQLGRLADLTNIARGGASSLTNTSQNYLAGMNPSISNAAQNSANLQLGLAALKSRGMGEFDSGLGQAAGIVGSLYGSGMFKSTGAKTPSYSTVGHHVYGTDPKPETEIGTNPFTRPGGIYGN